MLKKNQIKNLKEYLGDICLPMSGAKAVLIEFLSKPLHYNAVTIDPTKISTPFPAPKIASNAINNRTRSEM